MLIGTDERTPWPANMAAKLARADSIGLKLPARTREEADAQLRAVCEALGVQSPAKASDIPWKPLPSGPHLVVSHRHAAPAKPTKSAPLPAPEAARGFYDWLVVTGNVGAFGSAKLSALYASHCRDRGLLKTPENTLRLELKKLPGVAKIQVDKRFAGKGPRPVLWEISPAPDNVRRAA